MPTVVPTRMRFRLSRARSHVRLAIILACLCIVAAGCGGATTGHVLHAPGDPSPYWVTTFDATTTYAAALRAVTNLGLQPALYCTIPGSAITSSTAPVPRWMPVGQQDAFGRTRRLVVRDLGGAPHQDWPKPLERLPGVQAVERYSPPDCMAYVEGTPTAQDAVPLPASAGATYVRVSFDAANATYDTALATVSDLGLALVDLCYAAQYPSGTWHPMSQEESFARSHTLVVGTTPTVTAST